MKINEKVEIPKPRTEEYWFDVITGSNLNIEEPQMYEDEERRMQEENPDWLKYEPK